MIRITLNKGHQDRMLSNEVQKIRIISNIGQQVRILSNEVQKNRITSKGAQKDILPGMSVVLKLAG